jgi:hypothetical protein
VQPATLVEEVASGRENGGLDGTRVVRRPQPGHLHVHDVDRLGECGCFGRIAGATAPADLQRCTGRKPRSAAGLATTKGAAMVPAGMTAPGACR